MASQTSRGGGRTLRYALVGAVAGLLVFAIIAIFRTREQDTLVLEVDAAPDPTQIRVYVGGAVNAPGIYTLPRGSRVGDAVASAGGLAADADAGSLGMSALLEDGDQILVPRAVAAADATLAPHVPVSNERININAAGPDALDALPGIGPVLAARIIEYRTLHGPFQSVDELAAVQGISEAMVEELRPLITVGP